MKPLHIAATLLFLFVTVWIVTLSERSVRTIQSGYFSLLAPFMKSGSAVEQKTRLFFKEVKTSRELELRLQANEKEFGRLQATEARYKQIEEENKRLRSALGFQERSKYLLVASKVLRFTPSSWWETITIDRGEAHNIATQDPVITEQGLLGKVDRVWDNMATVLLITDESCQVSARIEDTPEFGIISGQRGAYGEEALLKLKYLSKDLVIEPGKRVLTTGKGGVFPDNIEIGTIISTQQGAFYSEALVKPSAQLSETEVIFAVIGPKK